MITSMSLLIRRPQLSGVLVPVRFKGHAKWQNIKGTKEANEAKRHKLAIIHRNNIVRCIKVPTYPSILTLNSCRQTVSMCFFLLGTRERGQPPEKHSAEKSHRCRPRRQYEPRPGRPRPQKCPR